MRVAAEDLKAKRIFEVYPGFDTYPMDESERFLAVAWKDLSKLRSFIA
jgi:hypothetical protein